MSTLEKLLDQLDESREALLVAIEPLPDEALLQKGAAGDWSVVDVLINQTAWEAELVTAFMNIAKKNRPDHLLSALSDPPKYDQKRYAETQERDLDQVFEDLQQVRIQIEDWLLEFSEKDLNDPQRYKWANNQSLSAIIAAVTIQREGAFLPQLQLFAQNWSPDDGESNDLVIPLTAVDISTMDESYDSPD